VFYERENASSSLLWKRLNYANVSKLNALGVYAVDKTVVTTTIRLRFDRATTTRRPISRPGWCIAA